MTIAIWIIAVCEVLRMLQNALQIRMYRRDAGTRDNAYAEFVKSLKRDDREMVKELLMEFEKQEAEKQETEKDEVVGVKLNSDYSWSEVKRGDANDRE